MSEAEENPVPEQPVETLPPPRELPGGALRRAREARGLTTADVSHALKFSPRQVEAIESDRFDLLPGGVFVRGFVRSYAKFLKLDEAPLLAMIDAGPELAPPEVRAPENMGVAADSPGRHPISLLVPAAAVLVLGAIGLGVWHFLGGKTSAFRGPGPAKPAAEAPASAVPVQAPQVRIESPEGQAVKQASTPPAAPAAPPPIPPGAKQILIEFSDRSWLEIKDATQKIVLTGEHPAGSRQVVIGKPPFQLWVGRASAVRVHYDDKEIDLRPHAREDVARLTVQ